MRDSRQLGYLRRGHEPRATVAAAVAVLSLVAAAPGAAQEVPPPPQGKAAATTLALLVYNRDLCDSVAGKVLDQWRRYDPGTAGQEAVRRYLTERELSNMAAARAAGDILRSLLPRARQEAGIEVSNALERFQQLVKSLCDTVALPTAPRDAFERAVADVLARMDVERRELGRLLVVPEEAQKALLGPYLTPIQMAAVEAESEYLDYLESQRPKPRAPTHQELMAAWHQRYAEAVQPAKTALGVYLQARQKSDGRGMAQACRTLLAAVIPLLRDGEAFKVPTPLVPASKGFAMQTLAPLEKAYREMRELATSCANGRSREVEEHFNEMSQQLSLAAAHLSQFSLAP